MWLYCICGFTVSKAYLKKEHLFGLPIVPFEEVEKFFPSTEYEMYIALVYNTLNRNWAKFYYEAKIKDTG